MNTSQTAEPYIEVWHGRVVIAIARRTDADYTVQRATNWRELEDEARAALKRMETPPGATVYPCPAQLARKANFADDMEHDWVSLPVASRLSGLSASELNQAIGRGYLEVRIVFGPGRRSHAKRDAHEKDKALRMVRRSQMHGVWSFPLRDRLHWMSAAFGCDENCYLNARFWKKARIGEPGECWPWQAGKSPSGYGVFWDSGSSQPAHRFAYRLLHGTIPGGKQVLHTCADKACVNPTHLILGD